MIKTQLPVGALFVGTCFVEDWRKSREHRRIRDLGKVLCARVEIVTPVCLTLGDGVTCEEQFKMFLSLEAGHPQQVCSGAMWVCGRVERGGWFKVINWHQPYCQEVAS